MLQKPLKFTKAELREIEFALDSRTDLLEDAKLTNTKSFKTAQRAFIKCQLMQGKKRGIGIVT